jgi:hypothetical protein
MRPSTRSHANGPGARSPSLATATQRTLLGADARGHVPKVWDKAGRQLREILVARAGVGDLGGVKVV